jgi:hypothetical protein
MAKRAPDTVTLDWSEVKHRFMDVVQDGKRWTGYNSGHSSVHDMYEWSRNPYREDTWIGGSPADTLKALREGFRAEEFAHSAEYVPAAKARRASWDAEEGDPDPGRLYGGYDDFYLHSADRESRPGLRLLVDFTFAAGVKAPVIRQYGAWVAGFIGSLEQSGYDLVVDLQMVMDGIWSRSRRDTLNIRVKRENEVSDFTEWSALFAPTGYRHLVLYTAQLLASDKVERQCSAYHGMTLTGTDWGVDYDAAAGEVHVKANQRAGRTWGGREDITNVLTEQATEAGLL